MSRAFGSSYVFRQIAGSEKNGGLQVSLHPRRGPVGIIIVTPTDWRTQKALDSIDEYANAAVQGINSVDKDLGVTKAFDIELSEFFPPNNESAPRCYQMAAMSALRSALEAWYTKPLEKLPRPDGEVAASPTSNSVGYDASPEGVASSPGRKPGRALGSKCEISNSPGGATENGPTMQLDFCRPTG